MTGNVQMVHFHCIYLAIAPEEEELKTTTLLNAQLRSKFLKLIVRKKIKNI